MKMRLALLFASLALFITACQKEIEEPKIEPEEEIEDTACNATYAMLVGTYVSDISDCKVTIYVTEDGFATSGLCGEGLWFPNVPLSGKLDSCKITIDKYADVRRKFESDDDDTYYFESMSGVGTFHPKSDSISLYISYRRIGTPEGQFSGYIQLKREAN